MPRINPTLARRCTLDDPAGIVFADEATSGDNPLSPEAATFAEEDPFDFGDISLGGLSREEIAEILIDAALDARDDAEFAWEESKHPRGQPGNRGKFGPGGGAENPHESRDFAIDVHGELTERPNTPIFQHPVRKAIEDRIVHLLQAGKSRSKGEVSLTFRPVYGMTSVHQGDGIVATAYYFPADGKVLVSQPLVGGRKQARFDEHTPPAELEYKLRKVLGLKVPPEVERQYAHINKAPRLANSDAEAAFDNAEFYDPNEARDEQGRWTTGGIGGVIADWHAHESGLSQEGATEEELQPLRQTLEKAQVAVEKKLTVYSELAGKLKEAEAGVKQLEAAEPAEPQAKDYPPEPKEPELPEEPTPAQEKAYDRWDRDYTKWVDAGAKVHEEYGRALERWERAIDRVRSRRDSLEERTDAAHEKLEDTIYAWQEKIDEKVAEAEGTLADRQAQSAEFYDPNQIRDHRGRWATGGGGGASQGLPHAERQAQRESAKETVRAFMAGKGSPSLQEASGLAQALSTLTVAQIHEVKREHGLKASSPDKAGLVKKLAERFRAAREAKPAAAVRNAITGLTDAEARNELRELEDKYRGPGPHLLNAPKPGSQAFNRDHDRIVALREQLGLQLWQRTQRAAQTATGMPPEAHRRAVKEALAAGKPVPAEVLKDYPDLQPKSNASDLRREAVKSAIGDTYSKYNGTHQLLQDIASSHDTLAGALSEAERQGLIDTRQRGPQSDVSPLQTDRQGEWVRRVLGQVYGEKEPANRLPTGAELERGTVTPLVSEASLPVGSTAKHDVATGTSPLFKVAIGGKHYFVKQIKAGSELAQAQGLGSLAVRGGDLDPIKGLRNEALTAGLAQIAGVPVPAVSATTFQGRQALVTEWLPGKALADVKDARSAVLKLPEGQVAQQLLFAYLADLSDRHLGNYFVSDNKLHSIDHEFGYDVHETDQHFQKREQIGRVFDNELFKLVGGPRHLTAGQGYDYPLPQSVVKGFAETASKMEATLREQGLHAEADAFAKRRAVVEGLATEAKPTMGTLLERIGDPNAKRRSPEEQLLHDREQRLSFKEERHARGELNQAEIRSMGRLRERIQEQKKGMGKP